MKFWDANGTCVLIMYKMQGWINAQKICGLAQILYMLIFKMEPIKLQCISSVELKDASGTSQIKIQLG